MRLNLSLATAIVASLISVSACGSEPPDTGFSGMWKAQSDEFGLLMLNLADGPDGTFVGLMLDAEQTQYNVGLWPKNGEMVGGITSKEGAQLAVLAQYEESVLYLDVYSYDEQGQVRDNGTRIEFQRNGSPPNVAETQPNFPTPRTPPNPGNSNTAAKELGQYLTGRHMLLSWIDGGGIYGKYYFLNTHYCPSGRYAVHAWTHKKSVLGGEHRTSWDTYGTWRVIERDGQVGVSYQPDDSTEEFLALEMRPNGPVAFDPNEFTFQGPAQCN